MRFKIATRIFNEEYFIESFLRYYQNLGANEICIFDGESTDNSLKIIERMQKKFSKLKISIKIVDSDRNYRHKGYLQQTQFCNLILRYAIEDFLKIQEDTAWFFPDVDEFIRTPKSGNILGFLSKNTSDIMRSVFIEWFYPPKMEKIDIKPVKILEDIKADKLRGNVMDLWGDPFQKDYVIKLNHLNITEFKNLYTTSGFHRLILNKQMLIPPNRDFLIVDHLHGVPFNIFSQRVEKNLELLKNKKDEWSYNHFSHLMNLINDYENFYNNSLKISEEIELQLNKIHEFDNSKSYFNNVIMRDNLNELGVSKPSMHDYKS